ncbi:acetylajmalan esterase-like [Daucus carota subsp. sativus]
MPSDLKLPDIRIFRSCKIGRIYQFGASFSDTGNDVVQDPMLASSRLPYGESTFLGPTGRYSDGLLVIDYIALAAGIPLLNPYLKNDVDFTHGVNFAVGGATALSAKALAEKDIMLDGTDNSLGVQVEWMSNHFASQCNTNINCSPGSLHDSLFVVGEIGRNDYHSAYRRGKTFRDVQNMVPDVTEIIENAVKRVIGFGASQVIIPGIFPMGCLPVILTDFKSNDTSAYDENGCVKEFNDVITFHNDYLQRKIIMLQQENSLATIVYSDYFNGFKWLLSNAHQLGFDATSALEGCCGNDGPSRIDSSTDGCGGSNVPVCSNPDQYINWDGVHFTQKAHSVLASWVVAGLIPKLNCAAEAKYY